MKNISLLIITLFFVLSVRAQTPRTLSFQGNLTDPSGTTIGDGVYPMTVGLFDVLSGGSALWTEDLGNVAVTDGIFNVKLGKINPLDPALFADSLWLEIVVNSETLAPRIELASSAYSFSAGSLVGDNFIPNSGNVHIGGNLNVGGVAPTIDLAIDDDDTGLEVDQDGNLSFYTDGLERMRINQTGNVGIGVTPSPEFKFYLNTEGTLDDQNNWSMYLSNSYSGASLAMGLYNYIGGTSTGVKYGYYLDMNNSGSSPSFGLYINHFGSTSGVKRGIYVNGEDNNYFSGNVGIGTDTPPEKLSVSGKIAATDTVKALGFRYTTPKTGYVSVHSSAFTISNNPSNLFYIDSDGTGFYRWVRGGTIGTNVPVTAPISLPHGAIIKDLRIRVYVINATYSISANIIRSGVTGQSEQIIATVPATTVTGGQTISTSTINTSLEKVDNLNYAYAIRLNTMSEASLYYYSASVRYTISEE